jgi:dTDP-4-dehydrorhamnose reductase
VVERLGADAVGLTRRDLDLRRPELIRPVLMALRPSAIINCAAYTDVDRAETDEATARMVNADAVGEMAAVACDLRARFVSFSTDYVFDGNKDEAYVESDATEPLNVYGRTKLAGEHLAFARYSESLIVRSSWILSETHTSFLSTMVDLIARGPVRVVNDQIGTPTMAADLADGVVAALAGRTVGLLHMANAEEMSWFTLAREIAVFAGLDPGRVEPCSTNEFPRPARRPANSCLSSERVAEIGLAPLPSHRAALERAIAQIVRGAA